MSLDIVGAIIKRKDDPEAPEVQQAMLQSFARQCRVVVTADHVLACCRVPSPYGPMAVGTKIPLAPIRRALAARALARMTETQAAGWLSDVSKPFKKIAGGVVKIAKKVGADTAIKSLARVAIKVSKGDVKGALTSATRAAVAPVEMSARSALAYGHRVAPFVPAVGPLAAAAAKAGPKLLDTIDAATKGQPKAKRALRALVARATAGNPAARRATAQAKAVLKLRGTAMMERRADGKWYVRTPEGRELVLAGGWAWNVPYRSAGSGPGLGQTLRGWYLAGLGQT